MTAWGSTIFSDSNVSRNGGRSIQFESPSPSDYIMSDYVNVPGEDTTFPYSLELTWKNTGGIGTVDTPSVDILWYSSSRALLATTVVMHDFPPTSFKPANGPTDPTIWTTSRAQGIQSPSSLARYIRIKIYIDNPDDVVWIDEISMYRCARAMKAGHDNVSFGWMTNGGGYYCAPMNQVSADPFYDRGSQSRKDSTNTTPNNGYYFLCHEPGTYSVNANVNMVHVFGNQLNLKDIDLAIVTNGVFNSSGAMTNFDQIVAEQNVTKTWNSIASGFQVSGSVDLQKGDRVSLVSRWNSGPGGGNIAVGAGGGAVIESYFLVRMHQAD